MTDPAAPGRKPPRRIKVVEKNISGFQGLSVNRIGSCLFPMKIMPEDL